MFVFQSNNDSLPISLNHFELQVSTCSGPCGLLERNENAVTANATKTPIAAPYTAIDASAMKNIQYNHIYVNL